MDRGYRLRDGLTPVALSVVVNACLFAVLARSFCASGIPRERYIAVELAPVVRVTVPATPKAEPKTVHSTPKPPPSTLPVQERKPSKPAPAVKRVSSVLPAKQEIGVPPSRREGDSPRWTSEPGPRTQPSAVAGASSSGGEGSSLGASSTGPGAYTGPGDGGGTSGGSASSGGPVTSERHGPQPGESRANPLPAEPPKPAPKGETRAAHVVGQVRPTYPPDARDDEVEGTTVVSISLDADGKVISAKVVQGSGDRRLDRAAVSAVERWKYSPCLKDGVPAAASVRVRVEFRLE